MPFGSSFNALAYNLGNFMSQTLFAEGGLPWSIRRCANQAGFGAKVVRHGRSSNYGGGAEYLPVGLSLIDDLRRNPLK